MEVKGNFSNKIRIYLSGQNGPTSIPISNKIVFDYINSPTIQKYNTGENLIPVNQTSNQYYTGDSTLNTLDSPGLFFHNLSLLIDKDPILNPTFNFNQPVLDITLFKSPQYSGLLANAQNCILDFTGCEGARINLRSANYFIDSGSIEHYSRISNKILERELSNSFGANFGLGTGVQNQNKTGPFLTYSKAFSLPNLSTLSQSISDSGNFYITLNYNSKASFLGTTWNKLNDVKNNAAISGSRESFLKKKITFNFRSINRPIWGTSLTRSHSLNTNDYYQAENNWGWNSGNANWHNLKLDLSTQSTINNYIVDCAPSIVYPGLKWVFSNFDDQKSQLSSYISSVNLIYNANYCPTGIEIITTSNRAPFLNYINFKPSTLGINNTPVLNHPYYGCKIRIERI